ncbi:hypothetical protein GCM10010234_10630 [Streptomyces hawaiiensis]
MTTTDPCSLSKGIPVTARLRTALRDAGLPYERLHVVDEPVHLADLPVGRGVHRQAVLDVLAG